MRIVAGTRKADPNVALVRALRNAHVWTDALKSGESLGRLAKRVGHSERYIRRIVSLISLSPAVQNAILEGTQPEKLTLESLVRGHIPLDWRDQDSWLGMYS